MSPPRSSPQPPRPIARLFAATTSLVVIAAVPSPAGAQSAGVIVVAQVEVPLPRVNPERAEGGAETPPPAVPEAPPVPQVTLPAPSLFANTAYRRLATGDVENATRIAQSSGDPLTLQVIDWLIATNLYEGSTSARMAQAMADLDGWPGRSLMQIRYEQALIREAPTPAEAIAALSATPPAMEPSTLLYARSLRNEGRSEEAAAFIANYWRTQSFSEEMATTILAEFGDLLSQADLAYGMSRFLYDGQNDRALAVAQRLGTDYRRLAAAWAAANDGGGNAAGLLDAVQELRTDPGYQYARLLVAIRAGNRNEAARILREAPADPAALIDPDAWAEERRTLGWTLVNRGNAELAYEVLSGHAATDRNVIVEIEFDAGWVALRRLDDPAAAVEHFRQIAANSSLPISQSRGYYWLGRALSEAGAAEEAAEAYRTAARYPTTFYGQLALSALGSTTLTIPAPPRADEAALAHFAANPFIIALGWLDGFGESAAFDLLARSLGDILDDPGDVALLATLLQQRGNYPLSLQVARLAANRGVAVEGVGFPTSAIPAEGRSDLVEMAFVYAIARQETAFNLGLVSSADARGLVQMQPGTARDMARYLGVPYDAERLLTDAAYSARLGGAYLRTLLDRYDGSFVLATAAYNAGMGRVDGWLETYGDPRRASVDTIDWIERIPFDETRNYVQRVLENLQVYRAILGDPTLRIADDLGM
ncbi:MAG: transglycosylase SLT domain-containing protein [Bauldia sp.]|nr:transglycosylase SLT domain-containing protein [Bauldia sp.]